MAWVGGGMLASLIGLPGMLDDLATWKGWMSMLTLSGWMSLCAVVLGLGMILWGLASHRRDRRRNERREWSEESALEAMRLRLQVLDSFVLPVIFLVALLLMLALFIVAGTIVKLSDA